MPRIGPIRHIQSLLLLTLPIFSSWVHAADGPDLEVSPLFGENSVIQRDAPIPIWGKAQPGEMVTVSFRGVAVSAKADESGKWMASLPELAAQSEPSDLKVTTSAGESWIAKNVLVGDVWLCAGQSNMVFRMDREAEAERELPLAHQPLIRLCQIPRASEEKPSSEVDASWKVCSPATVGDFSAVAYYFGKALSENLHVPIGLVQSSWGATPIQSWMARETLESFPDIHQAAINRYQKALEEPGSESQSDSPNKGGAKKPYTTAASGPERTLGFRPTGLYNGMIAPLTPMALRGIIWYQGEANASEAATYQKLFPAMICQWRTAFERKDLPFYFVQLPNFMRSDDPDKRLDWAWQREAQTKALALPATGMAVTIDLGDNARIHPKNKRGVGQRLSLVALAGTYGQSVEYSGPVLRSLKKDGASLRLDFNNDQGLALKSAEGTGFEVAGPDGTYFPATAILEGETVVVSSPQVPKPIWVRYAWHNTPASLLYNSAGLPAAPFRFEEN